MYNTRVTCGGFVGSRDHVRLWHKADMHWCTANVRFWGQSGHRECNVECLLMTKSGHCAF